MLGTVCPSAFAGNGIYEVSVLQTLIIFRFCSSKIEHVSHFGRHTLHHSHALAISGSLFGPKKQATHGDCRVVRHLTHLTQMGPGTLVRTPIPCARTMMTLVGSGQTPSNHVSLPGGFGPIFGSWKALEVEIEGVSRGSPWGVPPG